MSSIHSEGLTMFYEDLNVTVNLTTVGAVEPLPPSSCPVLRFQGVWPWDNPGNLVDVHTEEIVRRVKDTLVLPLLFLIGGPANVINMAVFCRQGLKERINVCLFSLSLADFLYLLFNMIIYGEQIHLQFTTKERYGPLTRFIINHNLLGFYGFTWVSEIVSAIIACERCFCILQPLRSQTVLSTSTTIVVITVIYMLMLGLYFMMTTRFRLVCVYDLVSKSNIWVNTSTQFFLDNQKIIDFLDAFVFGLSIPVVMMVVVTVTTIVTMIKLRQAAAWRAGTSSSSGISAREVSVTIMLVYNSIFFVACVFPVTLFRVVWLFLPQINAGQGQHNLFFLCLWLLDIITATNATFNFFIYYSMGSRYRQTFWRLMGRAHRPSKIIQSSISSVVKPESTVETKGKNSATLAVWVLPAF